MKRIITALIAFTTGAVIYLLFRPRHLVGFHLIDLLGLGSFCDQIRGMAVGVRLPEFVVYCLPNGLWSASYILLIDVVFQSQTLLKRMVWASIIPLSGILTEVLQYFGLCPGTFDIIDLLCYMVPLLGYGLVNFRKLQLKGF